MPIDRAHAMTGHRRSALIALMLTAAAVLALASSHVHRRHQIVRLGYELSRHTDALRTLREDNRRLRLEHAMLRHPKRIERIARALGMQRPESAQIRVVAPKTAPIAVPKTEPDP